MAIREVHQCQCSDCIHDVSSAVKAEHQRLNLLLSRLDEQERRWVAANESMSIGHGGDRAISLVTGLNSDTISRGRQELEAGLAGRPLDRVRLPGGGRPRIEKKSRNLSRPS